MEMIKENVPQLTAEKLYRWLMDSELTDEQMEKEVQRSRAVTSVAKTIIQNSQLALNAAKYANEMGYGIKGSSSDLAPMPAMLGVGKE